MRAGEGVYFDGVDDYAELDNVELGGPMTISLWVKWEAITDAGHLFDFGNGDTNNNIKIKNDQTTNTLQLELTQGIDSAATTKTVEASNYIDTDPFDVTNVLFTTRLTTTTTRLYKDGVLASYIDDGFEPSVLTRSKHVLGKAFGSNHFQGHIRCGNQPVCRVPSRCRVDGLEDERAVNLIPTQATSSLWPSGRGRCRPPKSSRSTATAPTCARPLDSPRIILNRHRASAFSPPLHHSAWVV